MQVTDIVKTSVLKPAITTIEQSLATRTMGQLRPDDAQALRDILAEVIAFDP
ncbi:hypothetical protein [Ideonella paludis]|uniref:Type II toxin-antitoxin system PemK/MazF family toxin n=1 Tax=Ideonella paludis TaxID=1233411 RepID=A0ABS5E0P2_9BURK|nr:hypothetical protein [Ideonella paludis]MBQ0936958.1 hypothetical protein [Ideonella paludis]